MAARLRWLAAGALFVALTLASAWPLLHVIGSALPNDIGDPALNTWIIWWNAQALPLTSKWWDGAMFYPLHGSLALSETFLNLWPLSTPMQWAGASAVLTYNVMYLLSYPTAALAAYALVRRLTGRHDAALLAGLAFGFAPYRAPQISHLQMLWSCWMPLGLLALHKYLEDGRRRRDLLLFGVCWIMNGLSSGYYLYYFSVLVALWLLWFARSLRDWVAIGVVAALASVVLSPLLLGYQHYQSAFGISRSTAEIEGLSADFSSLWTTSSYVPARYWTLDDGPEGELYPGATIGLLVVMGAIVIARRHQHPGWTRVQRWMLAVSAVIGLVALHARLIGGWAFTVAGLNISLTHPMRTAFWALCLCAVAVAMKLRLGEAWRRRSPFLFYAVAAVLMFLFALGPTARLHGASFLSKAPYWYLMALPAGHALRVPARFGMLFALCLSVASSLAFARLTPRGARALLVAIVAAAIATEGYVIAMRTPAVPSSRSLPGVGPGAVLLELPMVDDVLAPGSDTEAMLRATRAGNTLVNGYSGYTPRHYNLLRDGLAAFDETVFAELQTFSPLFVFVNQDVDRDGRYRQFIGGLPDARPIGSTADGTLFQLPKRAAPPADVGPPLRIAAVRTSANPALASKMLDGDLTTRWSTGRPQEAGDVITIVFDREVAVSRIEMDLGPFSYDFPRRIEIATSTAAGAGQVVWANGMTGAAMAASLADRERMPLVMNLPRPVHTRELTLTLRGGHPILWWSIAELKAFGR